jgi:hypothetical protein
LSPNLSRIEIFINPRELAKPISTRVTLIKPNTNKVTVQHRTKPHASSAGRTSASIAVKMAASIAFFEM